MDITLNTVRTCPDGIFGTFHDVNGVQLNVTLEHAFLQPDGTYAPKLQRGKTYVCSRRFSPEFKMDLFQITGVPDFMGQPVSFIEIHPGNWQSDSKGCVLTGETATPTAITQSRIAFDAFMTLQAGIDNFNLTVNA